MTKTKKLGDNHLYNDFKLNLKQYYAKLNLLKIYSLCFS